MNRFRIGFSLVYSLFLSCIYAETKTWTGTINQNWSTDLNWSPIGAPITGDAIVFDTAGALTTNVNISIDPASITFKNGVECDITGRTLTISDATCPLIFQNASTGQWLDGTTVNFGGNLELQGSGSTARFSTITGTGNLTIDQGMTCNLTQPAGTWTSSLTTVEGTLTLENFFNFPDCLPPTSSLVLGDNTSAQFTFTNNQTLQNLTGGSGAGILLASNNVLTLTSASGSYNGTISDVNRGAIVSITSPSTYILGGTGHSYSGLLLLNGGRLQANAEGAFPATIFNLSNVAGVVLDLNGYNNTIYQLNGGGTNGGNVELGGANLQIINGGTFNGIISDGASPAGSITQQSSFLTLGGNNTYTGGTFLSGGFLQISSQANLGNPDPSTYILIFNGDNSFLLPTASFDLGPGASLGILLAGDGIFDTGASSMSISAPISGSKSLTKSGNNTLTLTSGMNSYSGGTNIAAGTLALSGAGSLLTTGTVVVNGTFDISQINTSTTIGDLIGSGAITLGGKDLTVGAGGSTTFSGSITGTTGGDFTFAGGGTLLLSGSSSYVGSTTINGGSTLQAGSTSALASGSAFAVNGTLNLANFSNSIRSLSGSGSIDLGSATLTVANGGTFSGSISDSGSLTLTGGSLTLSGTNSYSGTTTVNAGATLLIGSTSAIGTSALLIEELGTVNFQNFVNTVGTITNAGSLSTKVAINAASFTQQSTGAIILDFAIDPPPPFGKVVTTGNILLNGSLTVSNTSGFSPTAGTQAVLFKSSGSGRQLFGSFSSPPSLAFGVLRYDYIDNEVILWQGTCDGVWDGTADGNWANAANWVSCVPGVSGASSNQDSATLSDVSSASITITLANSGGTMAQNILLRDLVFDSTSTSYTIEEFSGAGTITLDRTLLAFPPAITLNSGNHTIDAQILLAKNARFFLSLGSLTLGSNSSVGSTGNLTIAEGEAAGGVLINYGTISPPTVNMQGATLNNYGTISPSGTFTLSGAANTSGATLNNYQTLSANGITIGGGSGATVLMNSGSIFAESGSTLTVLGGVITNNSGATFGSDTADLTFSGGTIATSGEVLAQNYTQGAASTLQTNVTSLSAFGSVAASEIATLNGTFIVNATPGVSLVNGDKINLLTAAEGRVNQFANVSFQNFPSSLIPTLVYLENAVQLDVREANAGLVQGTVFPLATLTTVSQQNLLFTLRMERMRNRMQSQTVALLSRNEPPYAETELVAENASVSFRSFQNRRQPSIVQKEKQLSKRAASKEPLWSVYGGPIASFGNVKTKGRQVGMGSTSVGALLGFDMVLEDQDKRRYLAGWGSVLTYQKTWCKAYSNWGSVDIDFLNGSLYGTILPKLVPDLALEGIVGFSFAWDKIQRHTGIDQSLTALGNTTETMGDVLLGVEYTLSGRKYNWLPRNFSFVPLVLCQYVIDSVSGYTESNAGVYDLKVKSFTPQSLTSLLGSRFQYFFNSNSADVRLEFDAGWQRQYLNQSVIIEATPFNRTNVSARLTTEGPGRNSLILALDLLTTFSGSWQLETNCTYQWNSLFYDLYFYQGFGREF